MTRPHMRIAAMILILFFGATAYGQDVRVAGSIVYNDDDGDRNTDDSVSGVQLNVGWDWTDTFTVEGVLGYSDIKGWDGLTLEIPDEQHLDLAANILAFYDREAVFAPYFLVGIGYLNVSYDDATPLQLSYKPGEDGGSFSYTAGLGFKWRLGDSNWSIRGEYRLRGASDPISLSDQIGTLGFEYRFGRAPDPGVQGIEDTSEKPADTDNDGVLDMWDECANTPPGVDVTARGCEIQDMSRDVDDDRVPDYRDECPETVAGAPVDQRGCSLDSDMDGVLTGLDRCPGSRPGADVDEFGCEADNDRDGVLNQYDRCPTTRPNVRVDVYGCEIREVIELPGVNFGSGSDLLLPGFERLLEDVATTLKNHPDLNVEVAGHTDDTGDADFNLGLSERRAKTVMDHLIEYGIDPSRLTYRGYGESEPTSDNTTLEGRARNRRVELKVLGSE